MPPDSQEDSDDDEVEMGFISATQVNVDKFSKAVSIRSNLHSCLLTFFKEMRKKREALSSLAAWTHINCMKATAKSRIQDAVLRGLLHCANTDVTRSDEESLWDELDDDKRREIPELNVKDVPGGTVTFAFERLSMNV